MQTRRRYRIGIKISLCYLLTEKRRLIFLTTSVIDWRSDIGSFPDTDGDFSIAQIALENALNGDVASNSNRPDHVQPKIVIYTITTVMIVP